MADLTETSGKCRGRGRPFEKGVSGNPGGRPKGDAHPALFAHPVFHGLPILRDFFDRQWPADGSTDTVNAGAFRFTNPDGAYVDSHGPAMRAIYDLADLDRSVFLIALGQSAHVLSPHYARLFAALALVQLGPAAA